MPPDPPLALALLVPLLALRSPAEAAEAPDRLPGPVSASVTDVIDGDTLEVRARIWLDQEVLVRVRLEGIDTPERRARCAYEKDLAEQARELTSSLVGSGDVQLLDIGYDKYGGRVRARVVTTAGTNLADALVRAGLARAYAGGQRQPWC